MNVLVTGGFGFIGSTLVELLCNDKRTNVTVIDDLRVGLSNQFEGFLDNTENLSAVFGDISNVNDVESHIIKSDVIVHLAGLRLDDCIKNPIECMLINDLMSRCIGLYVKKHDKKMIFASTCSNYGLSDKLVNEESKLNPTTQYALAKTNAETFLLENVPSCIVTRFATAFGIGVNKTRDDVLINNLVFQAVKNKKLDIYQPDAYRPNLEVSDIAFAVSMIIHSKPKHNVYNIGGFNNKKIEIAKMISDKTSCELNITDSGDNRDYQVDFSRFQDEFNFRPKTTIKDGIDELTQYYNRMV